MRVGGHELETRWWGQPGPEAVVLLHEGLGSIGLWRDIPERLHAELDMPIFAYSRYGYGRSTPLAAPFEPDYMHHEGREVLPAVLAAAGIERVWLVGHSDGGSIALIHAGERSPLVQAVVVIAPHIFIEQRAVDGIAAIRDSPARDGLIERLAAHHDDAAATFWGWNDIWLDPRFRSWDIRELLPLIEVPVLPIQGERDEYATLAMVTGITEAAPRAHEPIVLAECGHIAHRDRPDAIVEATAQFFGLYQRA